MRIVYLLPHGWRFAGWSVSDFMHRYHFSKHIATTMANLGHEVTLLGLHESVGTPTTVQDTPFKIQLFPITLTLPLFRFGGDISLSLARALRRLKADILHIHGCYYESLPLLLRVAKTPIVLQWHGGRVPPLHARTFLKQYRRARRIVIPFDAVRRLFPESGSEAEKFSVVPLPLRPEIVQASPKSTYGGELVRLLYVGRIPRPSRNLGERRPDLLLRLLGGIRNLEFRLDIVGDGPGRMECEKIARKSGIEGSVKFHGYTSLDEIVSLYRAADLTIVPFALLDLTGTWVAQVQESLAMGTPVVTFSSDGAFSEHEIGWRISAKLSTGAKQLEEVLSDPGRLEAKGRIGPRLVRSQCDEREVARRLESVYRSLF